jgi:hypothetical protein
VAGDLVVFGDGTGRVHGVDRRTGKELWAFRTGGPVFSSPVVSRDLAIVGSADGAVYALRLGAEPGVRRAVFFDSTYQRGTFFAEPERLARFLADRGYGTLDAAGLDTFLRARAADRAPSVVVFAIDLLPADSSGAGDGAPLRRYLDAGGKVVWVGAPPLLWPWDHEKRSRRGIEAVAWEAPGRLLGVAHDATIFDARGVRVTPAGRAWGLPARWRDAWGVDRAQVTEALGVDEWGLAAAWVRSYGGPPGTGFVRVPPHEPMQVYLAAEYRPGG